MHFWGFTSWLAMLKEVECAEEGVVEAEEEAAEGSDGLSRVNGGGGATAEVPMIGTEDRMGGRGRYKTNALSSGRSEGLGGASIKTAFLSEEGISIVGMSRGGS